MRGAWRDSEMCEAAVSTDNGSMDKRGGANEGSMVRLRDAWTAWMIAAWMRGAAGTYNKVYTWNVLPAGLALHGGCPLVLVAVIDTCK